MFEWSNRTLLTGALLALVIVVFGFLPAADAAACAPEARADVASSSLSTSPDQDQGKSGDLKHSGCAHGHCHHGSTGMQPSSILVPTNLNQAGNQKAPKSDQMASRTLAGPDRPPRV
nr:hypothetical protein [uncultured Brevundimonas sp.]